MAKKKYVTPQMQVDIYSDGPTVMIYDAKHDVRAFGCMQWAWYRSDEKTVEMAKELARKDLARIIKRIHLKEPK